MANVFDQALGHESGTEQKPASSGNAFDDALTSVSGPSGTTGLLISSNPFDQALGHPADVLQNRGGSEPQGFLGNVVDLLLRGQYASAKLADTLLNSDSGLALGAALSGAARELIHPRERLSYKDVIGVAAPELSPLLTEVLGFAADVALDPTTYLTFGVGKATNYLLRGAEVAITRGAERKVIAKAAEELVPLSKKGVKVFQSIIANETKRGLEGAALRESAERRFSRLLTKDLAGAKTFKEAGGIKFAGKSLVTGDQLKAAADAIGVTRLKEIVGDLPTVKQFKSLFSRNFKLPEEYVARRRELEASLNRIPQRVAHEVQDVFGKLTPESRTKLGDTLWKIDEETRLTEKSLGVDSLPPEITSRIQFEHLQNAHLTPHEQAAYARFRQVMHEVGEAEMQAGLQKRLLANYSPRYYELIKDGHEFISMRQKLRKRLATFFTGGERRKFATQAEAIAQGFDPIKDAATLYSARVIEGRQALAKAQFNQAIETMYGKKLEKLGEEGVVKYRFLGSNVTLHPVAEDLTYIGESIYSPSAPPAANALLRVYDGVMSAFRKSATVIRPSFGVRQIPANALQSFLVFGKDYLGALDPRVMHDALMIAHGQEGKFGIKTALGLTYSGSEIKELAEKYGVVRNVTIEGVGRTPESAVKWAQKVTRELDRKRAIHGLIGVGTKDRNAAEGLKAMLASTAKYTQLPAFVEDFSRMSTFINALRLGHQPAEAAKLVDKALFDYLNGLSRFESRMLRRIVPFYSFNRFALPLVAHATATAPGRVANLFKTAETFFGAWNKITNSETLNDSERAAIPGWLLEQPHSFAGLDEKHRAIFRTFNNFTPLDVFGFIQTDDTGEFDTQSTLVKGALSQITPFIKIPLEVAVQKDFFTGRALEGTLFNPGKRNIGHVDGDKLLSNMLTMVAGQTAGPEGAVAGQVVGRLAGATGLTKEALKLALGWEEGIDPKTGKPTTFINPYLAHIYTSILPALTEAFNLSKDKEDLHPNEKVARFLFGVGTIKLDLAEQRYYKIRRLQQQRDKLQSEARQALKEQRTDSYSAALEEIQAFNNQFRREVEDLTRNNIRGPFAEQGGQ